ncbi:MAG: ABC transporter substrate-binding protein [Sulfobacillus acidophilus]|uniref:ABC transporter substrate-binding protein n=1 Tax=Sulfobacillus acidophilus TaxID=53633 RepID=A0A2T2WGH1_9FIRM|nr:MAG: ABC transporter substrate-binding protein [Sulfobacillus acidophilus]
MRVRSASILVGSLFLSGFLAACGSTTTHSTSASTSKTTVNTAVIGLSPQSSPNWFFPVLSVQDYTDLNTQVESLMYMPLLYINGQDQVQFSRSLASGISVSHDDTVYTIRLGHQWKWSNGDPVTAQDVVFTWNISKAASTLSNSPWLYGGVGIGGVPSGWKSVTAQGKYTVVVTLTKPANPTEFELNGLSQIMPAPASAWNKYPTNMVRELRYIESIANSPSNPAYRVVDGPYQFSSMSPNNYWDFVPNPHFDGHRSTLKKVVLQYEASSTSEFDQLKSGTVNVGFLPPSLWKVRKQLTGDRMVSSYVWGFNFLQLNFSPKAPGNMGTILSNLYVRQALQMGVNQPGIIKTLFHGQGVVENGPIPPEPKTSFYDPALNTPVYPYNPAQGKKLLEDHGWHEVNGVMTRDGQKLAFTLTYTSGSDTYESIVQLLKSSWAQEGIDVTLDSMPFDNVVGEAVPSDPTKWVMLNWGGALSWSWTYEPDYFPTGTGLFNTGAANNPGLYNSPTMNKLLAALDGPATTAQTQSRLYAYEKYAAIDLPVIWLPYDPMLSEYSKYLGGIAKSFNPIEDLYYPNYWTVK